MVVYSGERQLKDLVEFLHGEMEKAKKDKVLVTLLNSFIQVNGVVLSVPVRVSVCMS